MSPQEVREGREKLSRAIIEILDSWPEQDREIFKRAHYDGFSLEEIAEASDLEASAVQGILQDCDQRLREALRPFRLEPFTPAAACGGAAYAGGDCCSH
jgi:RNA polymerase sigma factor (sigma-70 family)